MPFGSAASSSPSASFLPVSICLHHRALQKPARATAEVQVQERTGGFSLVFHKTTLLVTYTDTVKSGSSANVEVVVSQQKIITANSSYPIDDSEPPYRSEAVSALGWQMKFL
jgi:hypothetical protein